MVGPEIPFTKLETSEDKGVVISLDHKMDWEDQFLFYSSLLLVDNQYRNLGSRKS